ncbi:hypothetical protein HD554DRAFT_1813434 [Boletus coccyginus]|nr:hypothetical protein HD554DRAFT_1813434 [Boletus coccyginus]
MVPLECMQPISPPPPPYSPPGPPPKYQLHMNRGSNLEGDAATGSLAILPSHASHATLQEPRDNLFTSGSSPPQTVRTYIRGWNRIIPALESHHLVVRSVSVVKRHLKGFQHECIHLRVFNADTSVTLVVVGQRVLSSFGAQKTKGRALDELLILSDEDQRSNVFGGMVLQQMTWPDNSARAPSLIDTLKLLSLTSQVLTERYTATSLNCYRFAIVAFRVIGLFRSEVSHETSTHKSFKQSVLFGMKLVDDSEVYQDIISVLVLFFERELMSLGMGGTHNKGKSKERNQPEGAAGSSREQPE